jgi:hypothetical protein
MNVPLLVAAILALTGTLVHAIGGERTDIKRLLRSGMPTNLKIELRMSWYLIAIDMATSGVYMLLVALGGALPRSESLLGFIALRFVLYGLSALLLVLFTRRDHLLKVPQWVPLITIGLLAWWGMLFHNSVTRE